LINGKWEEALSGETFATLQPRHRQELAQVALAGRKMWNGPCMAARAAFETRRLEQM
jgi:acyl-CoA reductase-like NAD-dependent aldehyde dehydrogenase